MRPTDRKQLEALRLKKTLTKWERYELNHLLFEERMEDPRFKERVDKAWESGREDRQRVLTRTLVY